MGVGARIRELRKKKGLTQKQLGELCGMADSAIRFYESDRGNPTQKTLERIADALGVSWEELCIFSVAVEQAQKLDEIKNITKQLETAEGEERIMLEYALEVLMESYEDVTLLDALKGSTWEELISENQQGAAIAADIIKRAGLTVKDKNGKVIHQGDGRKWRKMSDAEAYRAGLLQFHSEEDRIAFFYSRLNSDGKLAAGGCFFQHLDQNALGQVADYVMGLSENPLYQRPAAPQSTPGPQEGEASDTPETPPKGEE